MRVKIGSIGTFDHEDIPIMLILSEEDKQEIARMAPGVNRIAFYNDQKYDDEGIETWMDK